MNSIKLAMQTAGVPMPTLNVREAFELYKELHTMFKGSI